MKKKEPIRSDRLRTLDKPFGWLPCRLLTTGTLASMSPEERQLYLLLALAADRNGVSFYGDQRILRTLGCTQRHLIAARQALLARDLLAYDGTTYQLLSWPAHSSHPHIPTSSQQVTPSLPPDDIEVNRPTVEQPQAMPEHIRQTLRGIFGPNSF